MTELDEDSIKIYGKPLTGKYKHFCNEFDYLPIDEHCFELLSGQMLNNENALNDPKTKFFTWYDPYSHLTMTTSRHNILMMLRYIQM